SASDVAGSMHGSKQPDPPQATFSEPFDAEATIEDASPPLTSDQRSTLRQNAVAAPASGSASAAAITAPLGRREDIRRVTGTEAGRRASMAAASAETVEPSTRDESANPSAPALPATSALTAAFASRRARVAALALFVATGVAVTIGVARSH